MALDTYRNGSDVRPPNQSPARITARPPEPLRPTPARRAGTSLLAVKARRRRYRLAPPAGPVSG
jgi:hypothetical protein